MTIGQYRPGDVFYHKPTRQWVRVIYQILACKSCAFLGEAGICQINAVLVKDGVLCAARGYAKAKRPKNTIDAPELISELRTKETVATQARRYGKTWRTLMSNYVEQPKQEHKPIEPTKCWIVCLFFGGKLLPSAMPKQHKSLHSAMTESKRLAKLHDKTFIVLHAELVTQNMRVPMVSCL